MSLGRNPNPKWARVRRAERYFLRWAAPSAPLTDTESEAIIKCRVTPEAEQDLRLLLECKGTWQGGPLFGLRVGGELHIQMARSGLLRGYQSVVPDLSAVPDPYALNAPYMLGMSDMLAPAQVDWYAHWIAAPDSLMVDDIVAWAEEGLKRGLVDDQHPLIAVGYDRDGINYWAVSRHVNAGEWDDLEVFRP